VSLPELLAALRRHRWIFALCVLAGLGGGIYHVSSAAKVYRATSSTVISIPTGQGIQDALAGAQLSRQLLGTYSQVATSRKVAERVVQSLGLPESAEDMRAKISAVAEDNTYLIDVSARDEDPVRAASIADAAALALAAEVSELESNKNDPVRAQLLDRAIVPVAPESPRPKRDVAAGLMLGLLAGGSLLVLIEALDRTIKLPAQGTTAFDAPLLGVVSKRRGGLGLVAATDMRSPEAEAIRAIRTSVRFLDPDHHLQVLLVTSPSEGSGKTTLAANLAISMASGGERVLLIDADLRRASLTELLGLERSVGVSTVIVRTSQLDDSIVQWQDFIDVLPAGVHPPNAAELLGSEAMAQVLQTVAGRYDMVVIDAPPVLPVTDPVVLSTQADGVIMVVRYGRTSRGGAAEASRRLVAVGARVAGFVLNAVPHSESQVYYSTYGYEPGPFERRRMRKAQSAS
jgi:capsular exopolysaccharide synthesis family protein